MSELLIYKITGDEDHGIGDAAMHIRDEHDAFDTTGLLNEIAAGWIMDPLHAVTAPVPATTAEVIGAGDEASGAIKIPNAVQTMDVRLADLEMLSQL